MAVDVLLEIGLEELPSRFIDDAENQLKQNTKNWLEKSRIAYASITSYSTPRRLTVLIKDIAEEQASLEEEVKGPSLKIAKTDDGEWTKAAIGFTKGQGKTVDDTITKDIKDETYIFVKKETIGQKTDELLPELGSIIESIQFPKNMRWSDISLRYARPIRWITAIYGDTVIPLSVAGVESDKFTYGHRFLGEKVFVTVPADYESILKKNYVIVNPKEREQLILDGIENLEKNEHFTIPVDQELLDEVRNLVEYPTVFIGSFDESFLVLPSNVLITSMKEHQRYFPVKSADGKLLPHFIGVRNGDNHALETVVKGNEKVLRARLSDAKFFFDEDQKHSVDYYQQKLERIVFQEKLGTIGDKVRRVETLTRQLITNLAIDEPVGRDAIRAAEICKFDLPTNMVNEFTELQGIIGETYALHFGEKEAVAKAIAEHYLPIHADDELPATLAGAVVSIADKLDTITGCMSVGLVPTGSQDPYGLRRQAAGILKILLHYKWDISVESLLDLAQEMYRDLPIEQNDPSAVRNDLEQFFGLRITYLLRDKSIEQDVIKAVLNSGIGAVTYSFNKAELLSGKRNDASFKPVQEALVRTLNLAGKTDRTEIDSTLFESESEQVLYDRYTDVAGRFKKPDHEQQADVALSELESLADPIHEFFEHNMVMADDEAIRNNRLGLINSIAILIRDFADLSAIEWKQQF
ncbi:glycine--tRNA ligase subunit beta [Virgibacillus siamensis]|uniref:glycine--tRNA ligase subunit beta n=1 Tax=Virgibacillus siamensis TaxID=480071 RepID=UPI000985C3A9|nr:glycine--tRNA ligase subunit beta [Virgibacillus siamensis]